MHNKSLLSNKLTKILNSKSRLRLYSPQINQQSVFVLRRIAWAIGQPMTVSLDQIIAAILSKINITAVCSSCKDKQRCVMCPFKMQLPSYPDIEQLLNK